MHMQAEKRSRRQWREREKKKTFLPVSTSESSTIALFFRGGGASPGAGAKCSKLRDLVRFAIRIANRKSLAIWRARRCDSAAIWKGLQITNRAIWIAIWSVFESNLGIFLWFGLRDLKSLAICDLWFGALRAGGMRQRPCAAHLSYQTQAPKKSPKTCQNGPSLVARRPKISIGR